VPRAGGPSFFKRFNFQGRRIKMRGVHVWIVEAVRFRAPQFPVWRSQRR